MIRLGIIGDPIAHSLSPALHGFVLKSLGIAGEYRAYRVRESELQEFLATHRELAGFNVTIPHKERILGYLDELSREARLIGAVNTVQNKQGKLVGYNTDCVGFLRPLRARNFSPKRAILLGAGGAARAVAHALLQSEVAALTLYNRSAERALKLAKELQKLYPSPKISVADDPRALPLQHVDLLVNATPVGTQSDALPIPLPARLSKDLIAYDLVYNPPKTRLLLEAERRGARILGGLDMLIYQALESLKIWLERPDLEEQIEYDTVSQMLKHLAHPHPQPLSPARERGAQG
ncbi:MAG: shikimate dehydrogenase [Candidatus Bipolaricaulota bacterium]|nr:shikimate dehydrogenase [Candidatus Bipolaricaulota bacterium]